MTALSRPKHPAGPAWLPTQHRSIIAQAFRYLGAFLLNFIAAIEVAVVEVAATVFLVAFLVANGTGLQKIRTRSR
jgi:hypothetical protein